MTPNSLFGETIQAYVTKRCGIGCEYCASQSLNLPDIPPADLALYLETLSALGVARIELFANDPLLHPDIFALIRILNDSPLAYSILTIGDSPTRTDVTDRFERLLDAVDPEKGGIVFSVDYTRKTAAARVQREPRGGAFKAHVFWSRLPDLKRRRLAVRVNAVVSSDNAAEIPEIVRAVCGEGFAVSFCPIQVRRPRFRKILTGGLAPFWGEFEAFLSDFTFLQDAERTDVLEAARKLAVSDLAECFDRFRMVNGEADLDAETREGLIGKLLALKSEYTALFLPDAGYIENLGGPPPGCADLIRAGVYPQMKLWSDGSLRYCCDMHDPITSAIPLRRLTNTDRATAAAETIRRNPYVYLCCFANPCDFSVNRVALKTAGTGAAEMKSHRKACDDQQSGNSEMDHG